MIMGEQCLQLLKPNAGDIKIDLSTWPMITYDLITELPRVRRAGSNFIGTHNIVFGEVDR